jgi:hypothetical protein
MPSRRLAVALLAALSTSSCLHVLQETELVPFGHKDPDVRWWLPLSTSFTERASRTRGRPQRRFESTTLFPLDLTFFRRMQFDAYDGERVGETWGAVETPFFAWTFGEPVHSTLPDAEPLPRFETWGVPLIFQWREVEWSGRHWEYSLSHESNTDPETGATTTRLTNNNGWIGFGSWDREWRWQLGWDLGPSWTRHEVTYVPPYGARLDGDPAELHDDTPTFYPAKLLGLGGALWLSLSHTDRWSTTQVHGPWWGGLGYVSHSRRAGPKGSYDDTRLLGGILWISETEYVDDPDYADDHSDEIEWARHGPLWGMFGWGHDDGEPVIRVLWIPIPI